MRQVPRVLCGRSSAELRDCWRRWRFEPLARRLFRARPDIQSLTAGFSQFWDEGAQQAVHEFFAASSERDPGWLAHADRIPWWREIYFFTDVAGGWPGCDDDASLIVAFASCCSSGPYENYAQGPPAAWAIARRSTEAKDQPDVTIVGRVLRDYDWEDRWLEGAHRAIGQSLALDAALATTEDARTALQQARPSPVEVLHLALQRALHAARDGRLPDDPARDLLARDVSEIVAGALPLCERVEELSW